MEGKKPFSLKKWAKSRKGQQVIICVAFMTIPLLLLFVFTYLPFAEMVKFSFYKMKYLTQTLHSSHLRNLLLPLMPVHPLRMLHHQKKAGKGVA